MKSTLTTLFLAMACTLSSAADNQSRAPLVTNDEWTYRQSHPGNPSKEAYSLRFSISSVTTEGKLILGLTNGKIVPPSVAVWTARGVIDQDVCILDLLGNDSLGIKNSCSTKLTPGLTWHADTADEAIHVKRRFTVKGSEPVRVGAGEFQAIRIEAAESSREVNDSRSVPMTLGPAKRTHTVYWFAPQARAMVKIERQIFDAAGKRLMHMLEELDSFKLH